MRVTTAIGVEIFSTKDFRFVNSLKIYGLIQQNDRRFNGIHRFFTKEYIAWHNAWLWQGV